PGREIRHALERVQMPPCVFTPMLAWTCSRGTRRILLPKDWRQNGFDVRGTTVSRNRILSLTRNRALAGPIDRPATSGGDDDNCVAAVVPMDDGNVCLGGIESACPGEVCACNRRRVGANHVRRRFVRQIEAIWMAKNGNNIGRVTEKITITRRRGKPSALSRQSACPPSAWPNP